MGENSCSRSREFKSQHWIEIYINLFEKTEIKWKGGRWCSFSKKENGLWNVYCNKLSSLDTIYCYCSLSSHHCFRSSKIFPNDLHWSSLSWNVTHATHELEMSILNIVWKWFLNASNKCKQENQPKFHLQKSNVNYRLEKQV